MVPADSCRISRVLHYSGAVLTRTPVFGYRPLTFSGGAFQRLLLTFVPVAPTVLQPRVSRLHDRGLGSCGFARHYSRNHCCFLFLRVLRCFSSPGSPRPFGRYRRLTAVGCPIRTSAPRRIFAPPRGFSQLVTSFIASESLGILHVPLSPFLVPLRKGAFLYFLYTGPRLTQAGALFDLLVFLLPAVYLSYTACQLPSCQCALLQVVPGRVELPTSTLSV